VARRRNQCRSSPAAQPSRGVVSRRLRPIEGRSPFALQHAGPALPRTALGLQRLRVKRVRGAIRQAKRPLIAAVFVGDYGIEAAVESGIKVAAQ
jgi:hypothetical protein